MISSQVAFPEVAADKVDELCQHYLNVVYHDIQADSIQSKNSVISETSGEILYDGMNKLLSAITLTEEDIFVDLGSGAGKAVAQVFLKSPVKEALGIEILPALHQRAAKAAQRIHHDLPDFFLPDRKLGFLSGSIFEISLSGTTVALANSVCFTQHMLRELGRIIDDTASIHTVLTMRPIPVLQRLPFQRVMRIECSWDTALCYVYSTNK